MGDSASADALQKMLDIPQHKNDLPTFVMLFSLLDEATAVWEKLSPEAQKTYNGFAEAERLDDEVVEIGPLAAPRQAVLSLLRRMYEDGEPVAESLSELSQSFLHREMREFCESPEEYTGQVASTLEEKAQMVEFIILDKNGLLEDLED